ncbi:protein kinase domain-containing protein [Streptomyces cinnamoneus]|uniref:protein kinase domain-containing protein n=1 Tax=Streptomyces cinnamoneus TaxID=53446 RepID=UPI0037A36593
MPFPLHHDDPQQLGTYRLVARLGSGGMGTVYLGRSPGGRTVALKTMHARLASDPELRARFRLETDAARVIGGEYGAAVVDADPLAPTPWLATEYVLGPPLDEAVALAGPLPERSVRALGAVLAEALGQLHRSDVVHRDLKPSNILVTAFGPKVIDFGIARAVGDERLTRLGSTVGTPAFMSPEQAAGLDHTAAGDVFALAGVLVHAATGNGPFGTGRAADLLYRVRYAEPGLTGVPAALVPLLARCLDKDPARRPGTAELAHLLRDGDGPYGAGSHGGAGYGDFADRLPEVLLAEIARRACEVWEVRAHRLPAPPESRDAQVATTRSAGVSRRRLLGVTGGSLLGLAGAGAGAWAWFGRGDGAASASPSAPASASASAGSSAEGVPHVPTRAVWSARVEQVDDLLPPLVVGDQFVVLTKKGLVGLDATSRKEKWTCGKVQRAWQAGTDGERVYAFLPGEKGGAPVVTVCSVNLADGEPEPLGEGIAVVDADVTAAHLLAAADGVVYLIARTGRPGATAAERTAGWRVVAIDARTGRERWRQPLDDGGEYEPQSANARLVGRAVGGQLLLTRPWYEGHADRLQAWRAGQGAIAWRQVLLRGEADSSFVLPGRLAADNARVYFGSDRLSARHVSDGRRAWEFGPGRDVGGIAKGARRYGRPTVEGGVVYAAEGTRRIVAVSAASGELLWQTDLDAAMTPGLDIPPVAGERYLYVHATANGPGNTRGARSRDQLVAIDLHSHRTAWAMAVPDGLGRNLVAHERARVLVYGSGGLVCAVPFA